MAGLTIDGSIEVTKKEPITEARAVPTRKRDLAAKDEKSLTTEVKCLKSAIKHIEQAVTALDKIPTTSFKGNVQNYIQELEDIIDENGDGMKAHIEECETNLRKFKRDVKVKDREEEEEAMRNVSITEGEKENAYKAGFSDATKGREKKNASDMYGPHSGEYDSGYTDGLKKKSINEGDIKYQGAYNAGVKAAKAGKKINDINVSDQWAHEGTDFIAGFNSVKKATNEAAHYYKDKKYDDWETDVSKPANVSDGSSNGEQVYDKEMDPKNTKDEHAQLRTGDEKSPQDQSDGLDVEAEMKIPAVIKASLKAEIGHLKKEADKMDVSNKEASYFYNDAAKAFEDILDHLNKGTRYDFKLAQVYAQSLMGPMLHKLPIDVWKFLTNGGETRSLKDYMKPVDKKFPITGERNTIK